MLKKLRLKFIVISITALFLFLSIILGVVNIINYSLVASDADEITKMLVENGGSFNIGDNPSSRIPGDGNEPGNPGGRGPERQEFKYDTRYFSVRLNNEGEVIDININNTISYTEEEAKSFAQSVYKKEGVGWEGDFRYRVAYVNGDILVVSADFSRELIPSRTVLYTSLIVFSVGLILSLIVLIAISNLVIKPVKEATEKQKQFITNASHELKTPITIISANNELIELEHGESEETNTISRQIRKLSVMVQSLNNLSNIDEINKISEFAKFDLSFALNDVATSFAEVYKKENKELTIDIDEGIYFKGNENMLKELATIILENALKYSKTKAYFSLKMEENRIIIFERNDSDNIKDGEMDEVFERFYRSDDARAQAIEGSGIGLSIAKEITRLHNGRIKAKGEEGDFTIKVEL